MTRRLRVPHRQSRRLRREGQRPEKKATADSNILEFPSDSESYFEGKYDSRTGKLSVAAMQAFREPCKIPYAPPPDNDAKRKAVWAVAIMPKWNATMIGVMTLLIHSTNYYHGKCCPSEQWMANKLRCTDRGVRKAVSRIEKGWPEYLQVYHRNQPGQSEWKCNGYVIGWQALIDCYEGQYSTEKRRKDANTEEQTFRHGGTNVPGTEEQTFL